jgi:hypothetical protein
MLTVGFGFAYVGVFSLDGLDATKLTSEQGKVVVLHVDLREGRQFNQVTPFSARLKRSNGCG